ncbi:hypothetical protein IPJ72_01335 [Candidatus Peregrinibacteria bacterium]|nr:MAG: hypothetical protein IPJ72_01335 [Candidatus Peregrinibacteria bacterium]
MAELGVSNPKSIDVKEVIIGGGKIEVEWVHNHMVCRLGGKSTVYGDHDSGSLPLEEIEQEIQDVFDCEGAEIVLELDADL